MSQKVNPISMRLQVSKDWRSRWFAEKAAYPKLLFQDITIRKLIEKRYEKKASINNVDIERASNSVSINIKTAKPGVVIGRGGVGVEELKKEIERILQVNTRITIEEMKKPELYAKPVAENIASQLERRMAFRRVTKSTAASTMRAGAKGIRIEIAGRLNGAEMSRMEREIRGSVPLHTIRANIDYASVKAFTAAGIIGVKVWINKGENYF